MKRRMIAITAFMAVALAGCGQIDEPLTSVDGDNQPAAQIEIQTEVHTDSVTTETITETEKTSAAQPTTEKTSMETTSDVSVSETQAEEKQSPAGTEKSAATESTTQATTTQAETTDAPAVADSGKADDVFKMLDSLNYQAISCDGLPTHKLTAPDGTVYYLHLDENASYSYVWRRPSLIADADNEATLTQEVIDAIYANLNSINIVETSYF